MSGSLFDPLYYGVADLVVGIHSVIWRPVFGDASGWGWALSIVTLTAVVRGLLFPIFKRQVRAQRKLQELQPQFRLLREKYKNDRQKLNEEMMKIQKEHGNPLLAGCGPIVLQAPLFLSLFRVINGFRPRKQNFTTADGVDCTKDAAKAVKDCFIYVSSHGLGAKQVETIGSSKILGVPLAAAFNSPTDVLERLTASNGTVKLVAGIMILVMSGTTYLTQRQIMGRQPMPEDAAARAQQQMTQKVFLYLAPGMLLVSGLLFPVGVLTYWLTTNLWSVGQQYYVLRAMPPVALPGQVMPAGPTPRRSRKDKAAPPPPPLPPALKVQQVRQDPSPPASQVGKPVNRPKNSRPGGQTSKKRRKRR